MILPNKDRKTASVAVILKRLRSSDLDSMKSENSEYMTSEREDYHPEGEEHAREQMNEAEAEKLAPIAHKVMMALKQSDERAFASYMMDLIRMCK